MASSITVTCPECEKQLKASSEVLGKKIRCKACGATFVGRAAKEAAAARRQEARRQEGRQARRPEGRRPQGPPSADDDDDMKAYGVTHEYIGRRCPNCTEPMDDEQVVCLECGYNTSTRERVRRVKINDTTGGDIFWWLLPGILCVIAIITLLTLWLLYVFMVSEASFGTRCLVRLPRRQGGEDLLGPHRPVHHLQMYPLRHQAAHPGEQAARGRGQEPGRRRRRRGR